jgi:endo-alpha-1,4-polygalactosaminidase (GH114 family)
MITFRTGGKLKATRRQAVNGENIDVVDKFNYLRLCWKTACRSKQKALAKQKGTKFL